jgi:hypothetical protein
MNPEDTERVVSADGTTWMFNRYTHQPDGAHNTVIKAFARGGTLLDHDVVDEYLAGLADKAACSLLRDRWKDNFPIAAYDELLCTVTALRELLGLSPTPTSVEVFDWARQQKHQAAAAIDGPVKDFAVQFINGPYSGVILTYPGDEKWPAGTIRLPIVWGNDKAPRRYQAIYGRLDEPTRDGLWRYGLANDVPNEARPDITIPDRRKGVRV